MRGKEKIIVIINFSIIQIGSEVIETQNHLKLSFTLYNLSWYNISGMRFCIIFFPNLSLLFFFYMFAKKGGVIHVRKQFELVVIIISAEEEDDYCFIKRNFSRLNYFLEIICHYLKDICLVFCFYFFLFLRFFMSL